MKIHSAVFVTDGVNRHNILLPLAVLTESMEGPLRNAMERDLPYGMPANLGHDLCRGIGWSEPRGLYLAKDMARQLGNIYLPETPEDRQVIRNLRRVCMGDQQSRQIEPFLGPLNALVAEHASEAARLWHMEAAAVVEAGLASSMCPEYFSGSDHADKDGLVNFEYLLSRTCQIHPGVFHERDRGVLLFAHRYFRRSLSLRNSLNGYVLQSFTKAAEMDGVVGRLRLDPDMIGHPGSAQSTIELEYWHGPKYDDDVVTIPSGVAEHKNDESDRKFSGIDKTQFWWKDAETRAEKGKSYEIRTFEIEELIEDESPGLADGVYGCRYAHAEYDLAARAVSHFDGAIRAYSADAYLKRIECRIDRAGKRSDYTKLFRLDGKLPVPAWKRVLTDWYRGNRLIPEYLGACDLDLAATRPPAQSTGEPAAAQLAAFLCLEKAITHPPDKVTLGLDQRIRLDSKTVAVAEVGLGRLADVVSQWSPPGAPMMAACSPDANIARIVLSGDPPSEADWVAVAQPLAAAISQDASDGSLARVALAISWCASRIRTTLSIEGEALLVGRLLSSAVALVQPSKPASTWIEHFRDALVEYAPDLAAPVQWPVDATKHGRLTVAREDDLTFHLMLDSPDSPE